MDSKIVRITGGIIILIFAAVFNILGFGAGESSAASVEILMNVQWCGNGIINFEHGEECDGSDLNGETCVGLDFLSGTLSCGDSCLFDTSLCIPVAPPPPPPPPPPPSGGGGFVTPATNIVFYGRAYPGSLVVLLKDGQIATTVIAGKDGFFQINLSGISGGNYVFGVYAKDNLGNRSLPLNFPLIVTSGATTKVSGIFISPILFVDKKEVIQGDNIAIFGQSSPNSEILIYADSAENFFTKIRSGQDGKFFKNFNTSIFEKRDYLIKAKAFFGGEFSSYSNIVGFTVGTKTVSTEPIEPTEPTEPIEPIPPFKCPLKADLNNDCRVNLIDFSIAAYWYGRKFSESFKGIEVEELNGDGKINLVDFSIMAFHWTG